MVAGLPAVLARDPGRAQAVLGQLFGTIPVTPAGKARITLDFERVLSLVGANDATAWLVGSGGLIATNSTAVVHFPNTDRRKIRRLDIPSHCGKGHPLTPDNLRIERSDQRWRCLQCGRGRAAAFRRRRDRAE